MSQVGQLSTQQILALLQYLENKNHLDDLVERFVEVHTGLLAVNDLVVLTRDFVWSYDRNRVFKHYIGAHPDLALEDVLTLARPMPNFMNHEALRDYTYQHSLLSAEERLRIVSAMTFLHEEDVGPLVIDHLARVPAAQFVDLISKAGLNWLDKLSLLNAYATKYYENMQTEDIVTLASYMPLFNPEARDDFLINYIKSRNKKQKYLSPEEFKAIGALGGPELRASDWFPKEEKQTSK